MNTCSQPVWSHACATHVLVCRVFLCCPVLCCGFPHTACSFSERSISLSFLVSIVLHTHPAVWQSLFLSACAVKHVFASTQASACWHFWQPLFIRLEHLAACLQLKAQPAHKTNLLRLGPQWPAHQGLTCVSVVQHTQVATHRTSLSLHFAPLARSSQLLSFLACCSRAVPPLATRHLSACPVFGPVLAWCLHPQLLPL